MKEMRKCSYRNKNGVVGRMCNVGKCNAYIKIWGITGVANILLFIWNKF